MKVKNKLLLYILLFVILLFQSCAPQAVRNIPSGKDECPPPPPHIFTAAGIDSKFAQATFYKVVLGKIDIKTNPEVITLASKAVIDDTIRQYLRCLALKKEGFTHVQAAYFDTLSAFMRTKPTPEQFIEWQRNNPFPNGKPQIVLKFNGWYSKGVGEFYNNRCKEAIASFKKALETRPNTEPEAYTHNYIGLANYRLGNYPDAIENHSEAIKLLPKYDDAHTNRGVVYAALGNYKEAFADLNKACELYIIRGKYKKASINLKVMLTLLEKADIDEGMRKSAESDIEQFRKQMGEVIVEERIMKLSSADWYYKGVGEHINGKYDEAIISFKRVLDKTPDDTFASYTYNYIGASYGKAGNDTEALKNYTESIRLKPNNPLPFLNRGDVYRRSGQKDKAYEDLNTASGLIEREKINPKTKVFYNELLKMLENNLRIN
jgi:tetratricopeptide (TPR) repeat protein